MHCVRRSAMPSLVMSNRRVQVTEGHRRRRPVVVVRAADAGDDRPTTARRRRVRRRDRQAANRPQPVDLEKEMQEALMAEEAKWAGPTEKDLLGEKPHPLLGSVLESVVQRMIGMNVCCGQVLKIIFEDTFASAKVIVDYIEFRLLEVDGKGMSPAVHFFLDFGYREHSTFVLANQEKPIYCQVLHPPLHRNLPKIVLSHLKVDEDLSKECQSVIRKRMGDWLELSDRYGVVGLSVAGAPWMPPSEDEYAVIEEESAFAAWCMIHGFTPSTMAISVNEMRKAFYKFGSNPDQISLERIKDALADSYPMNPMSGAVKWTNKEETVKAVAPVAEVIPIVLSDGRDAKVPGSHVCFVERAILPEYEHLKEDEDFMGYEEEHYNPVIDVEFLTYMHGCIDTAVLVDDQARSVHEQVMQRAQDEGKVLTLDGSNEEDEELYREYFQKVIEETMPPQEALQR